MSAIDCDQFTDEFRLTETMGFLASSFDVGIEDVRPFSYGHAHVAQDGHETTFVFAMLPGHVRACAVLRWVSIEERKYLLEARSGEMH